MTRLFRWVGTMLLTLSLISAPAVAQIDPSLSGLPQASSVGGDEIISTLGRAGRRGITVNDLQRSLGIAAPRGAIGDGVADDSAAIRNVPYLYLAEGKRHRIRSNLMVGTILSNGGRLEIDPGVTVTFSAVVGDPATSIFYGEGTARSLSGNYSAGWYYGLTFDQKWKAMARAFMTGGRKIVTIPYPRSDDVAASYSPGTNSTSWKVAAPIPFDDPENNMDVFQYGALYGVTPGMASVLDFSPFNKSEDITWQTPYVVDAGNNAIDGIRIHAGARIQFKMGGSAGRARRDGINAVADLSVGSGRGLDEFLLGPIAITTENGRYGVNIEGTATNAAYGLDIPYVFHNGSKGLWATVQATAGAVTALTIDSLGPNGKAQNLFGFGYDGQVVTIQSRPGGTAGVTGSGNGLGATGTFTFAGGPTAYGTAPTGVTITAGGDGYVDGEKVFITSAEAVVRLAGPQRSMRLGRMLENQDDNSNLVSISTAYLLIEATTAGSPRGMDIGPIQTIQGRRPAIVSRDTSGGTASKFSGSIRGWNVPNPIPGNSLHQLELGWWDDVKVSEPPASPPNTRVVNLDRNGTVNARFTGVPREWVSGNGENYFFNNVRILYTPGLANNEVIEMAASLANVGIPLGTVEMITPVDNVTYRGQLGGTNGAPKLVDQNKGTLVETATTQLVTGTTGGTDGRATLYTYSVNGNVRFGIKNRLGSSLRLKIPLAQ